MGALGGLGRGEQHVGNEDARYEETVYRLNSMTAMQAWCFVAMSEVIYGWAPPPVPFAIGPADLRDVATDTWPAVHHGGGDLDEKILQASCEGHPELDAGGFDDLHLPAFAWNEFPGPGPNLGLLLAALRSVRAARHSANLTPDARERLFAPVEYALQPGVPESMVRLDGWRQEAVMGLVGLPAFVTRRQTWLASAMEAQAPWGLADQASFRALTGEARLAAHNALRPDLDQRAAVAAAWASGHYHAWQTVRDEVSPDLTITEAAGETLYLNKAASQLGNVFAWAALSVLGSDYLEPLHQTILSGPWIACLADLHPGGGGSWNDTVVGEAADLASQQVRSVGGERLALVGHHLLRNPIPPETRQATETLFLAALRSDDAHGYFGLLGRTYADVYSEVASLESAEVAQPVAEAAARIVLAAVADGLGEHAMGTLLRATSAALLDDTNLSKPIGRTEWRRGEDGRPRPEVLVIERFDAVSAAYLRFRPTTEPGRAVIDAISDALEGDELEEVIRFLSAKDTRFPAEAPRAFVIEIGGQLEKHYAFSVGWEPGVERRARILAGGKPDMVELARDLATDMPLISLYVDAIEGGDAKAAAGYVDHAVGAILDGSQKAARTKMGRKVKIEQAEKVFMLLARKGRGGGLLERQQVLWCDAVAGRLKPLRK
jgi:hypothetical protein